MSGGGSAVVCRGLDKRFDGGVHAVQAIDLDVPAGSVFGLLGPNGAGKTTAIRMLTTLMPPSGGAAQVAGHDIASDAQGVRAAIGYVPQVLSAEGALSGRENLLVFAKLYGLPRREREARIAAALADVGLDEAAERPAKTYSGGMVRRLEIAQALLHRPSVLFLDEPTIGLDPVARRAIWGRIEALRREHRMTVILTTHYMDEADALCDRIAILHRGRVVAQGTPAELKASLGRPGATLDEVFTHVTGDSLEAGSFQDTQRARRTARRLG
jgi:ABC-2 type transport system ATP-binding protein